MKGVHRCHLPLTERQFLEEQGTGRGGCEIIGNLSSESRTHVQESFFQDNRKFCVTKVFSRLSKWPPYCKQYLIQQNYNK